MLEVNNLCKQYGDVPALQNVSFHIERGEVVALLGANGSGKTTTINAICRLIEWESGDILFDGCPTSESSNFLANIGTVLGGSRNTNYRLTASQNAHYFARLRGSSDGDLSARIAQLQQRLGLSEHSNKEVMKLSTGNKQKAAMLCALAHQPALLLLDEPTLGLDLSTVDILQSIIEEQAKEAGQGFLITSHDMKFIDNLCSRVIVVDRGQLLFNGEITELKSRLFHYEMSLDAIAPTHHKAISLLWHGNHTFLEHDEHVVVRFDHPEQCLPTMHYLHEKRIAPNNLTVQPLSIEQAYQTLITQETP